MQKRLSPAQYASILPLFEALDFNLTIHSIVAGNTPAWVFMDRPASPHLALLWDRQDALFLGGDSQDMAALAALRNLLHNHILPDARARGIPEMTVHYTPGWEYLLPSLCTGLNARTALRYSYRYPHTNPPLLPPVGVPPGFSVHRIDEQFLDRRLDHMDEIRGWIDSFWHSHTNFFEVGYGYCIATDSSAAAWCLTVFAAGQARELGVATLPEFRGQGLATLAASACIQHAATNNLDTHWHCWADNLPSVKLADKLGFQWHQTYSVYRLQTGLSTE